MNDPTFLKVTYTKKILLYERFQRFFLFCFYGRQNYLQGGIYSKTGHW